MKRLLVPVALVVLGGCSSEINDLKQFVKDSDKGLPRKILFGEGLVGQCAVERKRIVLHHAPSDYVRIGSALGSGSPINIVILPVLFEGQVKAVIELASFSRFSEIHQSFLDQLTESIGVVLHTIRCPGRAWDQILLEVGPTARTCHRHIARFELLVQRGQHGQFIVRP